MESVVDFVNLVSTLLPQGVNSSSVSTIGGNDDWIIDRVLDRGRQLGMNEWVLQMLFKRRGGNGMRDGDAAWGGVSEGIVLGCSDNVVSDLRRTGR